jgi:acyl-CoA synthetase (AMP-forming)/AMP-acid ligase II
LILASPERIAEYTARGWWGTRTLHAGFAEVAQRHPAREAVVDAPNRVQLTDGQSRRLRYAQLAAEVDRLAVRLWRLGLQRDDIVVVQLVNSVEQYAVYLACLRLGLIISPVPVQYREHELDQILAQTQARAVITAARVLRHAAAAMWLGLARRHAGLAHVLAYGHELPPGVLSLEDLRDQGSEAQPVERGADLAALPASGDPAGFTSDLAAIQVVADRISANDIATVCWTSGTEAAPKGVPRSHNEWWIVAPSVIEAAGLQPGMRLLNPFPLVNMAGISACFATWIRLEATVVQHHPFDLEVFLAQLRTERIDYTVCPPAILTQLQQQPERLTGIDFQRLSRIGSGSAPLSEWVVQGWSDRGVDVINYFGSNEGAALTGSPLDIPQPAARARFFARSGTPEGFSKISTAQKIRTRLVDPDTGAEVTCAGLPGELRVTGPTIFSGYFRNPEATARAFDEQGYYRSGDLFEIAGEQGQYLKFVGRCKDIVVRGGMKISEVELETLLLACPGVRDAAVVGAPDAVLGERVCACVVPAPGVELTLEPLVRWLREQRHVAAYKLPERLLLLDALPRNPVGKVLKRELRARLQAAPPVLSFTALSCTS